MCVDAMNTLVLPTGTILAKAEGDMRSWGLNLASLPQETLYQLQDGVTAEFRAREGYTLQVLMEKKGNPEQVSLECDNLVAHNKELEQAMAEVCSSVPQLAMPAELQATTKIHHMVARFCKAQEQAAKAHWELNLQIMELRLKAQTTTSLGVIEQRCRTLQEELEVIECAIQDCTGLLDQSLLTLILLQEDPTLQHIEAKVRELQKFYNNVWGTA